MSVQIYSTPTCGFCRMAKGYLQSIGVPFSDTDVSVNAMGMQWVLDNTGQSGVPVLHIGNDVILGFSRDQIDHSLRANGLLK